MPKGKFVIAICISLIFLAVFSLAEEISAPTSGPEANQLTSQPDQNTQAQNPNPLEQNSEQPVQDTQVMTAVPPQNEQVVEPNPGQNTLVLIPLEDIVPNESLAASAEDNSKDEPSNDSQTAPANNSQNYFTIPLSETNTSTLTQDNSQNIAQDSQKQNISEESIKQNPTSSFSSSSFSSKADSGEADNYSENYSDYDYLMLEEIIQNDSEEGQNESQNLIATSFYDSNGKLQIEALVYEENQNINIGINETDFSTEKEWAKKVSISSNIHLANPVRVYSDINPTRNKNAKLYWDTGAGKLDVTDNASFQIEYEDSDDDGLFDRIGWTFPHLSLQNFEIILNLQETISLDNLSSPSIQISPLYVPSSITNATLLLFSFNVAMENITSPKCNFTIFAQDNNTIYQNLSLPQTLSFFNVTLSNGTYHWELKCYDDSDPSINNKTLGSFVILLEQAPVIDFKADDLTLDVNQTVKFEFNITAPFLQQISYTLDFGDGNATSGSPIDTQNRYLGIYHKYQNPSSYNTSLEVAVGTAPNNKTYTRSLSIQVQNQSSDSQNPEPPRIDLTSPSQNQVISQEPIQFSYFVNSTINIANCSLKVYFYNNTEIGKLYKEEYSQISANSSSISLNLTSFEEGDYNWEVECFDSKSQRNDESYDFEFRKINSSLSLALQAISPNDTYENKDRIESLLLQLNSFLNKMESYSKNQKEAMQLLKIEDDVSYQKKKLVQIKTDFQYSLKYISDDSAREKRRSEMLDELDQLEKSIPTDVKVTDVYEYSKNSQDSKMEEVVKDYASKNNLNLKSSQIKDSAEYFTNAQKFITYTTKAYQVEIDYLDSNQEITLVSKALTLKNESFNFVLESIPKDIEEHASDITFLTENEVIKEDPLIGFETEKLADKKIVYYFNKTISLNEIEKSDTLLFEKELPQISTSYITGFSISDYARVFDSTSGIYIIIPAGLLILVILSVIIKLWIKKMRLQSDPLVTNLLEITKNGHAALKNRDLEGAKSIYRTLQSLYPKINPEAKSCIYKKILKLRESIDIKESYLITKECILAVQNKNFGLANKLYNALQTVSARLDKKYQNKIRQKLKPYMLFITGNENNKYSSQLMGL